MILAALNDVMLKNIYSPQIIRSTKLAIVGLSKLPAMASGKALKPPKVPINAKTAVACIACIFILSFVCAKYPGTSNPAPKIAGMSAVGEDFSSADPKNTHPGSAEKEFSSSQAQNHTPWPSRGRFFFHPGPKPRTLALLGERLLPASPKTT